MPRKDDDYSLFFLFDHRVDKLLELGIFDQIQFKAQSWNCYRKQLTGVPHFSSVE
jgi:hypothetical protein